MACLASLYFADKDPLFLVILAVVAVGVILTLTSYLSDRRGTAGN
jgi:hypothetical protein